MNSKTTNILFFLLAAACDQGESRETCELNELRICECGDSMGTQKCLDGGGSWGECDCSENVVTDCEPRALYSCECDDGTGGMAECSQSGVLGECGCYDKDELGLTDADGNRINAMFEPSCAGTADGSEFMSPIEDAACIGPSESIYDTECVFIHFLDGMRVNLAIDLDTGSPAPCYRERHTSSSNGPLFWQNPECSGIPLVAIRAVIDGKDDDLTEHVLRSSPLKLNGSVYGTSGNAEVFQDGYMLDFSNSLSGECKHSSEIQDLSNPFANYAQFAMQLLPYDASLFESKAPFSLH